MRRRSLLRAGALAGSGVALSGCAAIDIATREPPRLFQLTPKSTFDPDLPQVEAKIAVEVPTATAGLNTSRIALRPTPTTLEFFAGANWIDVVPVMIQTLVLESLDNAGGIDVLGREVVGVRADYGLLINVREFQAEYDEQEAPRVRVRLQLRLVELPRRTSLATESFEHVVRARSNSLDAIVDGFDEAFGKVLKSAVQWTIVESAEAAAA